MKTPTSSHYPVLDNKPIDQLKVTELKEELKKRRLKTGGLKDELIRRLDEALRAEMEETHVDEDSGNGDVAVVTAPEVVVADAKVGSNEQSVAQAGVVKAVGTEKGGETTANAGNDGDNGNADVGHIEAVASENVEKLMRTPQEVVDVKGKDDTKEFVGNADANVVPLDVAVKVNDDKFGEQQSGLGNDAVLDEATVVAEDVASVVVGDEVSKEQKPGLVVDPVSREEIATTIDVAPICEDDKVIEGLAPEKAVCGDGLIDSKTERDIGDSVGQVHSEDVTPAHEDMKLDSSDQTNQVSEVSISLGFPVKSNNSVSTDSLSIIEKNDLKDNLNDDNVKLESDVKPEMVVQPSSSNLSPDVGESHPRDVDGPHENKVSVEETDNTVANAEMSQKNYSADLGSSEKLNLDRSSGDDSMEETAFESKQIHTNKIEDVGKQTEKNEATSIKAETPVATAMDTDLPEEKSVNQKNDVATLSDKRKFSDEEAVVSTKPAKRQHRWKKESNIVTEPQISLISPVSAQDVPQSVPFKRSLSRSDSMVTNDPPKEREVPPSTKPATNSLRIDHFLRPFTLKAAQELLGKTGTVTSFWMDHIKTHCYVTYSSIDEAEQTRNAVYNLQWPPNGGRQLVAEFVDPEEVKSRVEPPPPAPAPPPVNSAPTKGPEVAMAPQPSPRLQNLRQQHTLPPPPPISHQAPVRERVPPPPPPVEKLEAPIVTLDDLFRKTKATPRIYYLPLSDEQVAARRRNSKQ